MARLIRVELSEAEHRELVWGQGYGTTPSYRTRCAIVLLKAQGRSNARIAQELGVCELSVNGWVRRFQSERLLGLSTSRGQGRQAILQEADLERVRAVVSQHRQRLSTAKAELESELGKSFCQKTLERFVKKNGGRYKRIRRRAARCAQEDYYALKVEQLSALEALAQQKLIEIYYGDEAAVCSQGSICYGWQWRDEEVC